MSFPDFKTIGIPELLSLIACFGFLLLFINYLINYLPASLYKKSGSLKPFTPPVSVIICAKNEDDHLTEFLPKVMSQVYPEFEVIVVNDCSWDNTETVIDEFAKIFPNLRKANIKEDAYYKHGKKFAVLVGVKAAKNSHLLFTDADCYPSSENWLGEMVSEFSDKKKIVLGYGAYERGKGLLNKLIRYDAFIIATQYFSAAIRKKPYMGVGRNMAYTKELFFEQKGFSKHYHINSGDDDLFINQAADNNNTVVCLNKKAITYSVAKKTFKDWKMQKARHLTTAPLYKSSTKSKLAFNYFSQYFFYFSLFALGFSIKTVILIPILLFLKVIGQILILNSASKKLNERDLLAGSLVYELLLLFIYPIFHVTKFRHKPNNWNQ
jgi:glycosyltransferase involved in cell wall biosynthesis